MTILRRTRYLAAAIPFLLFLEVVAGGSGYGWRVVEVRGLVLDTAGRPLRGAEVFALNSAEDHGDLEVIRERDGVRRQSDPDRPPWAVRRYSARTDSQGRYSLVLGVSHCRSTGPIATLLRAVLGGSDPSPAGYRRLVMANKCRRHMSRIDNGRWVAKGRRYEEVWVYEAAPVRLEGE